MRLPNGVSGRVAAARGAALALLTAALVLGALGVSYSADIPIATIPVGGGPSAVAVNTVSNTVYVTDYEGDAVSVIDGVADTVLATVPVPPSYAVAFPIAVVTDPTRGLAYVADFWGGQVIQISEPGFSVTATMSDAGSHGEYPRALALDPASTPPKLYVANYGTNSVTVLNALTMARLAEIPAGDSPRAIGIFTSAGRRRVFVGNRFSNDVTIIDGDTDSVVGTATLDGAPKAIAVNGAGGKAYVTVPSSDHVFVIGTTDTVVATITVGDNPVGIDFRSAQYGLVACYAGNEADVIDAVTDSVVTTVATGPGPFNVAAAPLDAKWYVTNRLGRTVDVVGTAYGVTSVAVGGTPYQVAVNEMLAPREAYCSNFASDTVTVIDEPAVVVGAARPFAVTPAMAAEVEAARLAVAIDSVPGDTTTSPTPAFTGSVTGTTSPFEFAIAGVWFRVDGETDWRPAEITEGAGTSSVRWRAVCPTRSPGAHTLQVMAMDECGVASCSAADDGGASGAAVGGASVYAFAVEAPVTYIEETVPQVVRAGVWTSLPRTQFSGGAALYGSGAGRSVTVSFQGTGIEWIGARTTSGGRADVYLDGVYVGTVDQYARLNQFRRTMFASPLLPYGVHTLQVRATTSRSTLSAGYVTWVDAFRIQGTLMP